MAERAFQGRPLLRPVHYEEKRKEEEGWELKERGLIGVEKALRGVSQLDTCRSWLGRLKLARVAVSASDAVRTICFH